jgi:hypothetical protein
VTLEQRSIRLVYVDNNAQRCECVFFVIVREYLSAEATKVMAMNAQGAQTHRHYHAQEVLNVRLKYFAVGKSVEQLQDHVATPVLFRVSKLRPGSQDDNVL